MMPTARTVFSYRGIPSTCGIQSVFGLLLCYLIVNTCFLNLFEIIFSAGDEETFDGKDDEFQTVVIYRGPGNHVEKILSSMRPGLIPYSQVHQDEIVLQLTQELKPRATESLRGARDSPYFVDLAANDAVHMSNTARLEQEGWRGLCIEPNPNYWYALAHRKCKVAGAVVGGQRDGVPVNVTLPFVDGALGGIVGRDFDNKPSDRVVVQRRFTVSLKSLFEKFEVPSVIDYLSLDVEGAEELVMQDFPFKHFKIRILTVERPNLALQAILKGNGYRFISMIVSFGDTLWMHESVLESVDMSRVTAIVNSLPKEEKKAKRSFSMATGDGYQP